MKCIEIQCTRGPRFILTGYFKKKLHTNCTYKTPGIRNLYRWIIQTGWARYPLSSGYLYLQFITRMMCNVSTKNYRTIIFKLKNYLNY